MWTCLACTRLPSPPSPCAISSPPRPPTRWPLDADEFIDVPDRAALHAAIASVPSPRDVPCLAWVNAVPLSRETAALRIGDALLAAPVPSPFLKAVVTRALHTATGGRLAMLTGNHVLDPGDGAALRYQPVGTMLHIPLRSLEQMRRKTVSGALGHLARTDRVAHEGVHRFDGMRRMQAGGLTDADLLGWAAYYGEPGAAARPATEADLRQAGFRQRALDVAHAAAAPAAPPPPTETPSTATWAFIAGLLLSWRPMPEAALELVLDGTTLRARPAPPAPGEGPDIAALQAECRALRQETAIIRASTSWRLTAPLRGLARLLARPRTPR
jgi:hypothetical protein